MRDVLVASIRKGLFLPACAFFTFLVMILKMPGTEVSKLVFNLVNKLCDFSLLGYVLAFLLLTAWRIQIKMQRKSFTREIDRLAEERNEYQKIISTRGLVKSSRE